MLRVERVDNLAKLKTVEGLWGELLTRCRSGSVNIFLTFEWVSSWWAHFGTDKDLCVLIVWDGSTILGIAPLMVARERYCGVPARILSFLINRHTSRGDFIIADRHQEVLAAIVRHIEETAYSWDVLRLVHIPKQSGNLPILQAELEKSKLKPFPVTTSKKHCCLFFTGTWEDYLAKLPRKNKKKIRHHQNQLAHGDTIEFVEESAADHAEESMARLFHLERLSWKGSDESMHFRGQDVRFCTAVAKAFAEKGGLHNRFLYINGTLAGGSHYLIYDRVAYGMLIYHHKSFTEFSVGANLITHFIKDEMAASIDVLDFNGNAPYFHTWGGECWESEALSACNHYPYSRLIGWLKSLKRVAEGLRRGER